MFPAVPGAAPAVRPASPRLRRAVFVVALLFCFGALGLVFALATAHRRGRADHTVARRRPVWPMVVITSLVAVFALGAVTRAHAAVTPQVRCNSHVYASGRVTPEPALQFSPPPVWDRTRAVVTTPVSGLALIAGKALGMEQCAADPLIVTFWPAPRTSTGGTAIGDIYLAWMGGGRTSPDPTNLRGFGMAQEGMYVRFGPNITSDRQEAERLARHESRHVDQWAVFTLAGGPLAFPAAYYADTAFFPFARNHFERHAGLADGGYPAPPDNAPAPMWEALILIGIALLLMLRRRIRRMWRALARGAAAFVHRTPHTHAPPERAGCPPLVAGQAIR